MAETLTNLLANVREHIGNPPTGSVADAYITKRINASYREVVTRYRHPENEASETITTAAGTATDAVPSAYWYTEAMRDETNDRVLKFRPINWILAQDRDTRGKPNYFSVWGANFIFHPVPDGVYSITHYYKTIPTALSSGSDTTIVLSPWDEIIEWGAVWRVHQSLQEQDKMVHARNIWRTLVNSMPETKTLTSEQASQIIGIMDSPIPSEGLTE
jgi:hypothetical protein